ncbi:hypothetical protein GCM10010256_65840 [Streptomyces coeruleorubidus]|nr:hypothetical protein GCM10010256_65840 [Streptomyces coeruleorubidus]
MADSFLLVLRGMVRERGRTGTPAAPCDVCAAQYQPVSVRSWPSHESTARETRPLRLLPICV